MGRIFLSHSSADNDLARALRDWMFQEGWDDLFLDFDPERGIAPGEKWEKALYDAANRCEAVLFLVTGNWLASEWCQREFHLANKLNKRLFLLIGGDMTIASVPASLKAEWQSVELSAGNDWATFAVSHGPGEPARDVRLSRLGLRRLREGLRRAGLDARFFAWPPAADPERSPYPGLRALAADDAGIFFGREASIVSVLDRLRGMREAPPPRFLTILGASGAGKSSFLRAGLLPRLGRDVSNFRVLPVVRPERAALSGSNGLTRALDAFARDVGLPSNDDDATALMMSDPQSVVGTVRAIVAATAPASGRAAMLVLGIDQAEELFLSEGGAEAQAFWDILGALLTSDLPVVAIAAIRSDHYERLQSETRVTTLQQETFSLLPLPRGAYENVIVGPAARMTQSGRKLSIEPGLISALLTDIEAGGAKDALPLLAFTLALLFDQRPDPEKLTLAAYTAHGGIRGSIEAAVQSALARADDDPRVPQDGAARLALLRRAFIPWLAGVDRASNSVRRRVARLSEIPPEARPLVDCLVDARLLATDALPGGAVTIEPAHEALLRQWGALQGWLEEDFAAMAALEGVQRATRDWLANARDAGWLAHSAGRLEDAEIAAMEPALADFLDQDENDYLSLCREAEDERRNRELEEARKLAESRALTVRRTRIGLGAALVLLVVAGVAAFVANHQREAARAEQRKAEASLNVVHSRVAQGQADRAGAAAYALRAYRLAGNVETRSALFDAGSDIDPNLESALALPSHGKVSSTAMAWLGPEDVLVGLKLDRRTSFGRISLRSGRPEWAEPGWSVPKVMFDPEDEAEIIALAPQPDGSVYAARNSGSIELYRADLPVLRWDPPGRLEGYDYASAAFDRTGRFAAFGGPGGAVFVHCAPPSSSPSGLTCSTGDTLDGDVSAVAVDPEGTRAVAAFAGGELVVGGDGDPPRRLRIAQEEGAIAAMATDRDHVAAILKPSSGGQAGALALLDTTGSEAKIVSRGTVAVAVAPTLAWRRPGLELLHGCLSEALQTGPLCTTRIVETAGVVTLSASERLLGPKAVATDVAVSRDGRRAVSRDSNSLRIWSWPPDRAFASSVVETPAGGWASLSRSRGTDLLLSGRNGTSVVLAANEDPRDRRTTGVGDVIDAIAVSDGRVAATGSTLVFVGDDPGAGKIELQLSSPILIQGGLAWTGEGRRVVVCTGDKRVGVVDFGAAHPEFRRIPEPPFAFRPFGLTVDRSRKHVVVSDENGPVYLFDIDTRSLVAELQNRHARPQKVMGAENLSVSEDGRLLATTATGDGIMLYDLARNVSLAHLPMRIGDGSGEPESDTKGAVFDRTGGKLAAIDQSGAVVVWSLDGQEPTRWLEFRLPPRRASGVNNAPRLQFAQDGSLVVLTPSSDVLRLGLDDAGWARRLARLGYDRPAARPD